MITPKSRILLVDDLDLTRRMIRKGLETLGFKAVDEASDGDVALEKINSAYDKGQPFDLVFLDWNMPKMNGIQVLEACRSQPRLKDLIIIMVTAEAEKRHVLKALTSGAMDYIIKPCTNDILQAKIEHLNLRLMNSATGS